MERFYFLCFFAFLIEIHYIGARLELTNVKCKSLDPTLIKFEYCVIKAINRSYKYLSMKSYPMIPINNATLNFQVMKRANGYKPFLYNMTLDGCRFMAHQYNPVMMYVYRIFKDYSNFNHTCPYDHPFIVEKLPISHLDNLMTNVLPFPHGDYALYKYWTAYNRPMAEMRFYSTLS